MSDEPKRQVYSLSGMDAHDWADMDDDNVYPEQPRIPGELQPAFTTGEEVDELDDLNVYGFTDPPSFGDDGAIEATPEELAAWKAAGERYLDAASKYRRAMAAATTQYYDAHEEGLKELRAAFAEYQPVESALKARVTELAAKLHKHREAAKAWEVEQYEKEQANLDAIHGPRAIVLYEPNRLGSRNKADHIARVHLTTCNRQRGKERSHELRAHDAWRKLTDRSEWPHATWPGEGDKLRIKLCSFCKPWTVLAEHAGVTAEMIRSELKLTEWPEGLR